MRILSCGRATRGLDAPAGVSLRQILRHRHHGVKSENPARSKPRQCRSVSAEVRSSVIDYLLDWSDRHFVQTYLLDATTDLGIPTVYCLQVAEFDACMRQAVACATARTITLAAEKALLEVIRTRLPGPEVIAPDDLRDFSSVGDGAAYMGRAEIVPAFHFLTASAHRQLAPPRSVLPEDATQALGAITSALADRGMRAIAVDRTPRELVDVGITAVCVPGVAAHSLLPLAQYRAHPRLYQAPLRMGYRSLPAEELNPWPQPFA